MASNEPRNPSAQWRWAGRGWNGERRKPRGRGWDAGRDARTPVSHSIPPTVIEGSWVKSPGRKKQRVVGERVTDSGLKAAPPGPGAPRLPRGTKGAERAPLLGPPPARQPAAAQQPAPLSAEARGPERSREKAALKSVLTSVSPYETLACRRLGLAKSVLSAELKQPWQCNQGRRRPASAL